MHAWICDRLDGPEALRWQPLELPPPAAGEVRVAIHAASLNFPDLLIVQGKYQMRPPLPFVPGAEFAGVVQAVGDGVKHLVPGTRVAGFAGTGGFGTHVNAPAGVLMPLPDAFSFEDGAAFLCTYGTSHHALMDRASLQAGETVLVLGAAGGVGTAAVQIAKAAGAKVIAAVSTAAKAQLCRSLGADETIQYPDEDLRQALKAMTQGQGPDVIYDPVGGELTQAAFRSIAWRGRHLVVGFADGHIPELPLNLPLLKGASVMGVFWGEFAKREPQRNAAALMQLAVWYMQGKIKPVISHRLPMASLAEAFALMSSRQVQGKVVLTLA